MTGSEITSLVAALVSLIISGFAIWLSVTFYKLTTKNSKDLEKASSNIDSTVTRLEVLFDKLYSDTFNMMKDTVTDMRKHVWKTADADTERKPSETEQNFNELKNELNNKIEKLMYSQGKANDKVNVFAEKIENLISETIDKSAKEKAEKSWEEKENLVVNLIKENNELSESQLRKLTGLSEEDLTSLIFILGKEKRITWKGGPNQYSDKSKFKIPSNA